MAQWHFKKWFPAHVYPSILKVTSIGRAWQILCPSSTCPFGMPNGPRIIAEFRARLALWCRFRMAKSTFWMKKRDSRAVTCYHFEPSLLLGKTGKKNTQHVAPHDGHLRPWPEVTDWPCRCCSAWRPSLDLCPTRSSWWIHPMATPMWRDPSSWSPSFPRDPGETFGIFWRSWDHQFSPCNRWETSNFSGLQFFFKEGTKSNEEPRGFMLNKPCRIRQRLDLRPPL